MIFAARYDSRCEACGGTIPAGSMLLVYKSDLSRHYHPACTHGAYREARRENET